MIPLGYYLPPTVSKMFSHLAIANGVDTLIAGKKEGTYNSHGQLAFTLQDGFLESFFVLDGQLDMRLHAALVASGAKHSGAEKLQSWPVRFLIHEQILEWHDLELAEAGIVLCDDKGSTLRIAESEFLLGVRIGLHGTAASFVTDCLDSNNSSDSWETLKMSLQSRGFIEMSREDLKVYKTK